MCGAHRRGGSHRRVQPAVSRNANIVYHPRANDVVGCNIETGKRVSYMRAHLDNVTCIAVQAGSEQVFSAGLDCNLLVRAPPESRLTSDKSHTPSGARLNCQPWTLDPESVDTPQTRNRYASTSADLFLHCFFYQVWAPPRGLYEEEVDDVDDAGGDAWSDDDS
jgi:hypothetical protein